MPIRFFIAWALVLALGVISESRGQSSGGIPGLDLPADPAYSTPPPIDLPPLGASVEDLNGPVDGNSIRTTEEWFSPFMMQQSWSISFELGINGNQGNSDTLNLTSGLDLEQKNDLITNSIRFRYNQATADGTETKNNAMLKLGHERQLGDTPWSLFARNDYIYDRFKAFDLRIVLNGGLGYTFFTSEVSTLKGRFGAGASREIGGPDNDWVPEAVLGLDYKRQLTQRQKLTAIFDYYPQIDNFNDFRMITDVSWELLVDDEANLSLKLSVLDEYDSTPNGRKPNDLNYAFLLLWKR